MTHPAQEGGPGRLDRRPVHSGRIVELSLDTVRFPDGSVGELELIRHLCDEGVRTYDMGFDLDYKRRWAEMELVTVTLGAFNNLRRQ